MKPFTPKKTLVIINGLFIAILVAAQLTLTAQVTPIVDTHHLMWSNQLGTPGTDKAEGIACEFMGNTYTVGHTSGSNIQGATQFINSYKGGNFDGYITKSNIYGHAHNNDRWPLYIP